MAVIPALGASLSTAPALCFGSSIESSAPAIKAPVAAIEKVRDLPPDRQAEAADILEQIVRSSRSESVLSADERVLVGEGSADLDAGRIVPDDEMAAFWNRHRK